jgi:hypothetical protein
MLHMRSGQKGRLCRQLLWLGNQALRLPSLSAPGTLRRYGVLHLPTCVPMPSFGSHGVATALAARQVVLHPDSRAPAHSQADCNWVLRALAAFAGEPSPIFHPLHCHWHPCLLHLLQVHAAG